MRIKVIGLGGIGGALMPVLTRYLNFAYPNSEVTLIDGDHYEDRNSERQEFAGLGNKAEVTVARLKQLFDNLLFLFRGEYVTADNVYELIREGDVVFLGVDNHASRKLVSDRCEDLNNITLISGGNDFTDGNVQIYVRQNGQDLTLPIANDFHPEIMYPEDDSPADLGCGELAASEPQHLITNNAIASSMLAVFYAHLQSQINYDEIYVDILTGNSRAVNRRQTLVH